MVVKLFESAEKAVETIPKGSIRKLVVKGHELIIMNTTGGFKAAQPLCPHMNEPLHKGKINAYNEIICPLHEYRFNLETGAESSLKCDNLTLYKVTIKPDGLYLEI